MSQICEVWVFFIMRKLIPLLPILFLVAMVRIVTWRSVFVDGDVAPYDADPHYRLREIQRIARHFPHAAPPDPYVLGVAEAGDPTIARSEPWLHPAMFLTAWTLAGFDAEDAALRKAAMFVPVLWGVFTVALAYAVTLCFADVFAASMAALFAGLCMPILWRTTLGALDNHMSEGAVFLALLLVAAANRRLPENASRRWFAITGLGAVIGGCAMLSYWAALGALLLCAAYSLGIACFVRGNDAENGPLRQAASLACALLTASLLNLLFRNPVSALCLAGAGTYLLAQTLVWRRYGRGRFAVWGAALALGAAVVFVLAPGAVEQLAATARVAFHLSKNPGFTEQYYSAISETVATPLSELYTRYSFLVFLTPIFFGVLLWRANKNKDLFVLTICFMAICLVVPSLRNSRFSHMAAAALAPVIGWGLSAGVQQITGRFPQRRFAGAMVKSVFVGGMIIGFLPYVQHNARVHAMRPDTFPVLRATYRWIEAHTPSDEHFWEPAGQPPYRIMAMWDLGWPMLDLARRVPVANNAGEGVKEELDYFFRANPEEAAGIAAKQHVRYVLASGTQGRATIAFRLFHLLPAEVLANPKQPENERAITRAYLASMHARLYVYDGGAHTDANGEFPALGSYRLLHESPERSESPLGRQPMTKVFELVPGARIAGNAQPGTEVTASLELETNAGRKFTYADKAKANAQGRFQFILPYATEAPSGETKPLGKWRFETDGKQTELEVPAAAVETGADLIIENF